MYRRNVLALVTGYSVQQASLAEPSCTALSVYRHQAPSFSDVSLKTPNNNSPDNLILKLKNKPTRGSQLVTAKPTAEVLDLQKLIA